MRLRTLMTWMAVSVCIAVPAAAQEVREWTLGGAYLGVEIRDVTSDDLSTLQLNREAGVVVESVQADTPAATAGIQQGDVILEYSGVQVLSVRHLQRLVADTPIGREVVLQVQRAGRPQTINVTIEERPGGPESFEGRGDWGRLIPEIRRMVPNFEWDSDAFRPFSGRAWIARGPRLGVSVQAMTDQLAEFLGSPPGSGLLIMEVEADSPAETAGLKAGDVILSVDGKAIEATSGLRRLLTPGTHELEIVRERQKQSVTVDLGPKKDSDIRKMQ